MNKFTDFSDQVTFVSSQITGRDFSKNKKGKSFITVDWNGQKYTIPSNMKSAWDSADNSKKQNIINNSGKLQQGGQSQSQQTPKGPSEFYNNLKNATDTQESAEKKWGKGSPEAELAKKYRNVAFERAETGIETDALQNKINNLKLEAEKSKLQRKQDIKEAGGRINYATGNLIEQISNSKAGKKLRLTPFHNTSSSVEYTDDSGKIHNVVIPRTSTLTYLADNGDRVAKAAGEVVTTAAKTAGNAALKMTGYQDSKDTVKLKNELKEAKKASKSKGLKGYFAKKKVEKLEGPSGKISESEKSDKFSHIRKVSDTVGAGVTVAKTALSSKARENAIRQEGVEGLQQKQAKLLYMLGDRSKDTKIAVGDKEGLGFIDRIKSSAYQRKIDKNRRKYRESLTAQYAPQSQYVQYAYPKASGFSEEQVSALSGILSKNFSEPETPIESEFEGLNLSWQPEEYAKLNTILEADFETLDAQIAETQPDMSEKKVKEEGKVDEQQVEDSQSGEIDVSDTIDYNNLDPETMTALVDTSYYEVPKEEKEYQEMIAKGFAEKDNSYNSFLESMSDFADKSSF